MSSPAVAKLAASAATRSSPAPSVWGFQRSTSSRKKRVRREPLVLARGSRARAPESRVEELGAQPGERRLEVHGELLRRLAHLPRRGERGCPRRRARSRRRRAARARGARRRRRRARGGARRPTRRACHGARRGPGSASRGRRAPPATPRRTGRGRRGSSGTAGGCRRAPARRRARRRARWRRRRRRRAGGAGEPWRPPGPGRDNVRASPAARRKNGRPAALAGRRASDGGARYCPTAGAYAGGASMAGAIVPWRRRPPNEPPISKEKKFFESFFSMVPFTVWATTTWSPPAMMW